MILSAQSTTVKEPKITLVGAGPGDPELISLKGINAIKSADVILYDANIDKSLLDYAPEHATKIFVGSPVDDDTYSQETVNKLIIDYALNFGHVVRLKTGDLFVFGRGYEELDNAASYSIQTEIIPGISSAVSVPGLQGVPVTHRGMSDSLWIISATDSKGNLSPDLYTAAKTDATVVIMLGIEKVAEIVGIYQKEGRSRMPVAVIQHGSTKDEKVVVGNIKTIAEAVEEKNIGSPALIVIGAVVGLHPLFQPIREFYEAQEIAL
ncbi:uroporphyrinogen-III C-methyltransferase [Pedobacter sp. HMF7647]|uniref:uroporphyrinogen-III C-methyltransferase n=1 Tax=Hufsiella arboris TaxID=2695275 RepID=A0A7K1YDM4_9SPHI|nr:uroporphyrinogen-III C-methyltransferase [Hufsiella arboris]MXV52179.1 uroporphyrinogen-III C-methyltransferase [Hufsiella arboris]